MFSTLVQNFTPMIAKCPLGQARRDDNVYCTYLNWIYGAKKFKRQIRKTLSLGKRGRTW